MPIKSVYLTIDDSPSIHMKEKVDFLREHSIPALFFCRGEFIQMRPDNIIYAIQKGFPIGNHSYSHPYFSNISLCDCFNEIKQTEELIEKCYQQANIPRPCKIIRLPFGDRGAGPKAQLSETLEAEEKTVKIQEFLKEQGFVPVDFGQPADGFIDAFWDWDTQDYKTKFIENPNLYASGLIETQQNSPADTAILLLHDFDRNHHLFRLSMEFLTTRNIQFLPFNLALA